jgi:hypothetical protein
LPIFLRIDIVVEIFLDMSFDHLYVRGMFDALTHATLTTPPRKGIGARIVRRLGRMGAVLHGVVAGRLRRRPSRPDRDFSPDADSSTAARPAHAPRRARRTAFAVPDRHADLAFTKELFPDLTPGAREFLNTPLEECDPAMLGLVLEALAGAIAGVMTPQEGMRDARDVFLALNSRLGALTGGMQGTLPESVPVDPDTPADPDAAGPQAAAPDMPGSAPGSAAPPADGSAQGEAAAATAGSGQAAAPPVAQRPSGPALIDTGTNTGTNTTTGLHDSRVGPRRSRRRSLRGGRRVAARGFASPQRSISYPIRNISACVQRPPRLLCYAACAGPPALPGAPNQARPVTRHARGHRMAVPQSLIPGA